MSIGRKLNFIPLLSFGIRQKMIFVLLGVLIIALSTTSWLTYRQQEQEIIQETQHRTQDIARFVSQSLAFSVIGYDYHTMQNLLDELIKSTDISYAQVTNVRGNEMAQAGTASIDARSSSIERDIFLDESPIGRLRISIDHSKMIQRLNTQKFTIITGEISIIILIVVGQFFALSKIIIKPLSIVTEALTQGIDENGAISKNISLDSKDEFGILARQFNEMRSHINDINLRMHSKIEATDSQLKHNYDLLQKQSKDLQQLNEDLQRLSVTDTLTGIFNRRHFDATMETDLALSYRHGEIASIIVIDIDHFKKINDTYGHAVGDQVLVHIAKLLTVNLRKTDTVCRIGGEEFVAICRRANIEDALVVAEKIRQRVEHSPFQHTTGALAVTVSIGIASIPPKEGEVNADEIFWQADAALYHSKNTGRNRVSHFKYIDCSTDNLRGNT